MPQSGPIAQSFLLNRLVPLFDIPVFSLAVDQKNVPLLGKFSLRYLFTRQALKGRNWFSAVGLVILAQGPKTKDCVENKAKIGEKAPLTSE